MKTVFVILFWAVAGCSAHVSPLCEQESPALFQTDPVVCFIQNPAVDGTSVQRRWGGSLIPLGGQRALTARHVPRQPVVYVDGKLTGIDTLHDGGGEAVSAGDWVILQVNDAPLPMPDDLVGDHVFREDSCVYLCGFVSAVGDTNRPTLIRGVVGRTPLWTERPPPGVVIVNVEGSPNLSGMSGGPVVIPNADGTSWRVVGVILGTLSSGWWTAFAICPLPEEALARTESTGVKEPAIPD